MIIKKSPLKRILLDYSFSKRNFKINLRITNSPSFKGTVMQIGKALINYYLRVSKVS